MAEKKNKKSRLIIDIVLIVIFGLTSVFSFAFFATNKQKIKVGYADNGDLDYKVYLKDNNFFEKKYIESGSTYVSSLIDYIDINYNYNMKYSEKLTGNYTYKVVATLSANKVNEATSNYFEKEYILDTKTKSIEDSDTFIFNDNIKIKYQDYIDVLNSFKETARLSVDGVLKIDLIVESNCKYKDISKNKVKVKSLYSLSVPLTESSVNIELTEKGKTNKGSVVLGESTNITGFHAILLIVSIVSVIIMALIIIKMIDRIVEESKSKSEFEKKLDKILTTYNSIIVNVNKADDLSNYKIITLDSFDELLDAHSEVRMPINYFKNDERKEAIFILLNEDVAWVYRLK